VNAEEFNSLHPVGTPVFAYPVCRPEDCPNDPRLVTRTRSKAERLGGHTDVVWVDGYSSCIAFTHIDVVSEDEWAAAKEAEAVAAAEKAANEAADCRRRIYVDGKGDGWIDLSIDPVTGERELTGITNPWKVASAEEVRADTGGLTEIGRCW